MLIDGVFFGGACDHEVAKEVAISPYDGRTLGTVAEGDWPHCEAALDAAHRAFDAWKRTPRHERQALLRRVASKVRERSDELGEVMSAEVGKPITWARAEVARLAVTFDLAADLLSAPSGVMEPADMDPRGVGHWLRVERFPVGVVLAIVPYNWPYNLAAHKLAPALAAGCTVVLKPSRAAALSTMTLARLIHECGCPPGVLNAVNVAPQLAERMALDARVKFVSFTGSPAVGWALKAKVPEKRVSLELGGNGFAWVCRDADLDWAAQRIAAGAYGYAGQVCIAVQHVLCEESVYPSFRAKLIDATRNTPWGDPSDPNTVCGPLISSDDADRVLEWVEEAVSAGASVLAGGNRVNQVVEPTLVEGVPPHVRLGCEEVFGPVATVESSPSFQAMIERVNAGPYGIHCGVFTRDLALAERAFQELEVGGVVVGDGPTLRLDAMPYGGVKRSGFGREGVRYAFEEMTEPKAMLVRAV